MTYRPPTDRIGYDPAILELAARLRGKPADDVTYVLLAIVESVLQEQKHRTIIKLLQAIDAVRDEFNEGTVKPFQAEYETP
jgi:hypothetical protein